MHEVLERQLRQLELPIEAATPSAAQWRALLACVEQAYTDADESRSALERSSALASAETQGLHVRLAAAEGKAHLRSIFESATLGIFQLDAGGLVLDANPAAVMMIGATREELVGRKLATLFDAGPGQVTESEAGDVAIVERRYTHPDGRKAWFRTNQTWERDAEGAVQFGTMVVDDVTAKKRLEVSLRHAQKLESVGRLASGIAHEINTPIQFVNDNVHFLQSSFDTVTAFVDSLKAFVTERAPELLPEAAAAEEAADWSYLGEEIPKSIEQTLEGLKRVATIVQSMKNFAHNDRGEHSPTDLNATLASTLIVATHELKGVALATENFGEIPHVVCSSGDLSQVFLNLIVNAAHAIGDVVEKTGKLGRVTVATRRDGDDVVVSISDTGGGIPRMVRDRLFEPFFTTKAVGRGTGQGLALARSIVVEQHGGTLTFESEVGVGTTFYIRLPIGHAGSDARAA